MQLLGAKVSEVGVAYPAFSKIDENNFYLAWLTKDTINNFMNIYERRIYFGSAAGIKEPAETDYVLVAPNPFSSQTILHSGRPLTNATLTLKNCSGQTVRIIEHINGKEIALYRHDLPAGLYFICLADSHFLLSGKFAITD